VTQDATAAAIRHPLDFGTEIRTRKPRRAVAPPRDIPAGAVGRITAREETATGWHYSVAFATPGGPMVRLVTENDIGSGVAWEVARGPALPATPDQQRRPVAVVGLVWAGDEDPKLRLVYTHIVGPPSRVSWDDCRAMLMREVAERDGVPVEDLEVHDVEVLDGHPERVPIGEG
jgi:hypothetical protein